MSEKTTATQAPPQRAPDAQDGRPAQAPCLAEGIDLIGKYEDSGYKEPPYIARRADGQVIQLPYLLYAVCEQVDGRRDYGEIAERVSESLGRGVSTDNVQFLCEQKLRPLGVLVQADGSSPEVQKLDPMLALRFRTAVVPQRLVRALTTIFYPFYYPVVVAAVLAGLVAVDVWFFFIHGVAQSARELVYNPILLLMVLGLVVVATALHEIGHATAARYGGAEPGVMGVGIYVVWPAFYTDVTDAYRLNRTGRLRTDLGGVYFNVLFILGTIGAYALTGFEPLLIMVLVQHFQIMQQFLPFLRLDGYYILSDLTGVPDMFARIKPTLKSALPGQSDERAEQLKPWVRVVTTGWVLTIVPVLLFVFGLMIFNAPRMFATAYDSFFVQTHRVSSSFAGGNVAGGVAGVIQTIALVLPVFGMTYSFGRGSGRAFKGAWTWSEGAPLRRLSVISVTAALAALGGYVLIPNGEYKPVQPTERGTVQGGLKQFAAIPSGRPGLTEKRERELGGAPAKQKGLGSTPTGPGATTPSTTEPAGTTTHARTDTAGTATHTTPAQTQTEPSTTTTVGTATTTETATTQTP